jgi:hypothetical protein
MTTYRDAFCTPCPDAPPSKSVPGSKGLDTFTITGRFNSTCNIADPKNNANFG